MIMHIVQLDLTSQPGRYSVENSAAGSRDACSLTSPPSTSTGGPSCSYTSTGVPSPPKFDWGQLEANEVSSHSLP